VESAELQSLTPVFEVPIRSISSGDFVLNNCGAFVYTKLYLPSHDHDPGVDRAMCWTLQFQFEALRFLESRPYEPQRESLPIFSVTLHLPTDSTKARITYVSKL
jgi:hypothetical protein